MRAGHKVKGLSRIDALASNITTTAYSTLFASVPDYIQRIHIANSTGQTLVLALGPSGSETDYIYIPAGTDILLPVYINIFERISVKAVSGNAMSGDLIVNIFG